MPFANKVILIGTMCADVDLSYTTKTLTPVGDFSLVINQASRGCKKAIFIPCRMFGKQAHRLNEFGSKGSLLYIEGSIDYEHWETKTGQKQSRHRILVQQFQLLRTKKPEGQAYAESEQPDEGPENL